MTGPLYSDKPSNIFWLVREIARSVLIIAAGEQPASHAGSGSGADFGSKK